MKNFNTPVIIIASVILMMTGCQEKTGTHSGGSVSGVETNALEEIQGGEIKPLAEKINQPPPVQIAEQADLVEDINRDSGDKEAPVESVTAAEKVAISSGNEEPDKENPSPSATGIASVEEAEKQAVTDSSDTGGGDSAEAGNNQGENGEKFAETGDAGEQNTEAEAEPVKASVAELAGVLDNQRPQTLDPEEIGQSLKDPEPLATDPDYATVNFNKLASFKYEIPDEFMFIEEGAEAPKENIPTIPDNIKKLNGEKVAVTGFMLPLKVEKGLVTELLLMRDQSMCCFGTVPEINEWISIKTKKEGEGFKPVNDQAVTFFGDLKVGEIRENGYLVGIYEMDGHKMVGPENLKEF